MVHSTQFRFKLFAYGRYSTNLCLVSSLGISFAAHPALFLLHPFVLHLAIVKILSSYPSQDALTEKASCLEEKEEDLRKLRRQLREREREVENSNAVLLATEETIDSLERDVKDRDSANKKLAAELKDKDKLLRVS